jgi:hypothetical protein
MCNNAVVQTEKKKKKKKKEPRYDPCEKTMFLHICAGDDGGIRASGD